MGACTSGKNYNKGGGGQTHEHHTKNAYSSGPPNRMVTINQEEVVVAKLKVQKDRMEARIKRLDEEEKQFRNKALMLAKSGRKEEAIYACRQKKRCKEYRKKSYQRMDFIDRQITNVEQTMDDVAFTKTLAESNRVLEKLNNEIDMEEIRIAKELHEEGKMRREELDELLDDDDDDIKKELDRIEAEMLQEDLGGLNVAGRQNVNTNPRNAIENRKRVAMLN